MIDAFNNHSHDIQTYFFSISHSLFCALEVNRADVFMGVTNIKQVPAIDFVRQIPFYKNFMVCSTQIIAGCRSIAIYYLKHKFWTNVIILLLFDFPIMPFINAIYLFNNKISIYTLTYVKLMA